MNTKKKSKHLISYNDDTLTQTNGLIWRHSIPAVGETLFDSVENRLRNIDPPNINYRDLYPHIVLGHVRRATSGPTGIVDPHPFVFETPERDYSFIHNGGVKTEATYPSVTNMEDLINLVDPNWLNEHPILSGVDSEYFYSYVMCQITHNNNNIMDGLKAALHEMVENNVIINNSAINFILTDGVDLYAYRKMQAPETDNIHPLSYFYYREAPFNNYFAAVMSVFPNTLPSLCVQEIMDDELIYISKTGNIVKFKNFSEQGSEILTYVRDFHEDINWSSFPVMQGAETQITSFLAPLITDGGLHTLIYGDGLENNYEALTNEWQFPNQLLTNRNLYKLDFTDDTTPFTSGGFHEQGALRNSQVPVLTNIEPWQEYWIGYHLLPSQNIMEAFGAYWEFVESVESENWYFTPMPVDPRKEPGDKEEGVPIFPPAWSIYNKNMDFGKGYVVTFNTSLPSFNWENPHHIDLDQLVALKPEKPELFNYTPLPKYIAIDILDSDDPVNVLEIGAYQGVKCIGAVKPKSLPCQLLAYPDWSDPTPITFEVVWKEAKSKSYVNQYKIWDKEIYDFIPGCITASENYYQVKLGNDSGNDNTQTPVITVQNAPNPFIDETSIIVKLTSDSNFSLTIYNVKGQKVVELFEGNRKAGKHAFFWDGKDEKGNRVSTGIYFSRICSGSLTQTSKMLVVK